MKLLQSLSPRQRIVMGVGAAAVILVAFLLFNVATKPGYTLVATGLDPAKTGKMTAALDTSGVAYQLRNNGTALAVRKGEEAQAQVALAGKGLSASATGDQVDLSSVDKLPVGASQFQQQITYQRGLEGEIANAIGQVDGVPGAEVHLTMPKDELFTDEAKPATAAVLLEGDSSGLAPGAVKGIANIVASSVENLKTQNVTITDASGQLLWPTQDDTATAGATSKEAAQARFEAAQESQIDSMLLRTVGPGKAEVSVNADLNVDKVKRDQLQFGRGVPTQTTKDNENLRSNGAGAGASAGTQTNIPGYAAAAAGAGGNSTYRAQKGTTTWSNDKTVTSTEVAPGAINRETVALVLDRSIPPAQVSQIRNAVAGAAGIDPRRGDRLTVSSMPFAPAAVPNRPLVDPSGIVSYAKYALLGIASLVFLFFVTRHLRRREDEALAEPTWLRQLDAPMPVAQLEALEDAPTVLAPATNRTRSRVEQTVDQDPQRVATALRTWMAEDEPRGAQGGAA
jgi:flagellar M-ring protein FliF